MKTISTTWEVWSYDVLGNRKDGWEVNNRSCEDRAYPLRLKVTENNLGSPSGTIRQSMSIAPQTAISSGNCFAPRTNPCRLSRRNDAGLLRRFRSQLVAQ